MISGAVAANTGFLFKDRPFLERIALAAQHGFGAVEFHDEAQGETIDDVRAALREADLPLLGLNTRAGDTTGCAGIPGEVRQARADIDHAIETAHALGGRAVHVLAGKADDTVEAWATYRANLLHAADTAPNLTILIEPLSPVAVPGYLLPTVAKAASVVEFVGRTNVKIMFDLFHVAQVGDDIERTFADYRAHIGHMQISDPQTRHEPSPDLLRSVRRMGWTGSIGAEYDARGAVADSLDWMHA